MERIEVLEVQLNNVKGKRLKEVLKNAKRKMLYFMHGIFPKEYEYRCVKVVQIAIATWTVIYKVEVDVIVGQLGKDEYVKKYLVHTVGQAKDKS